MVCHKDIIIPLSDCTGNFPVRSELFSVGSNIWRSTSLVFSPALVGKGVTFVYASFYEYCLRWYKCPLVMISDSGKYFEISLSVSPGHVAKYPSLIA